MEHRSSTAGKVLAPEKSGLPLAGVTQIDGHTSRVLVAAACHDCFESEVRSTSSFTIAFTVSAMFALNWIRMWPTLGPKGVIVVDDIDANWAFQAFTQTIPDQLFLICEAEPIRPDLRRFNKKGLFGIVLKATD